MRAHSFVIASGWAGAILGLPGTVIQYRRVLKDGVEGISLATWLMFAYMCIYWIIYGWVVHSLVMSIGSLIVFPIQLLVISHLSPLSNLKIVLSSGVFIFLCSWLPAMIWGWSAGLYGTGIAMVANRLPQLNVLIREKHVFGVSAWFWAVLSLGSLMWVVYYFNEKMIAPLVATGVTGIANLLIMSLTIWRHHQVEVEDADHRNI